MKYRYFWILLLAIFAIGCAETELLTILSDGSHATITAPPEKVWQATEMIREEVEKNIPFYYTLQDRQYYIEAVLQHYGMTLEDFDVLTMQKAFYTKYIDAAGIAILANAGVADEHLIEARQIILSLTAKRPELRDMLSTQRDNIASGITKTYYGQGFYMILVDSQFLVPELIGLNPFNGGSCYIRGSLRSGNLGYCYANLIKSNKSSNKKSDIQIFVHEFAHAIHFAIRKLDPTFDDRLRQAYAHQMGSPHVSRDTGCEIPYTEREVKNPDAWITGEYKYAQANCREYWAVAIEYWCYGFVEAIDIPTHEAFKERDPMLTELIEEWLPRIPARK